MSDEKELKIIELEKELIGVKNRALKVHEKNEMLMSSPDISQKIALMDYELKIAKQFADSKAFPSFSPEQIYTIIQAGKEFGISPVVSLNMLYIVNGSIKFYGDKMIGYILMKGYRIRYENETDSQVTAIIFNEVESYSETAKDTDQIIQKSKAAGFAKKNKLRFHAVRMIASFHLPHLFMGVSDVFNPEYTEWKEENKPLSIEEINQREEDKRTLEFIEKAKTDEELETIEGFIDHHVESEISTAFKNKKKIINGTQE